MAKINAQATARKSSPIRRVFQIVTSKFVLIPFGLIAVAAAGVLFHYWNLYTDIIDRRLRGDIFVRSSGIYAAPLDVFSGSTIRMSGLVTHLRNVGYVERGTTQNEKRGQFVTRANTIEIYPGTDGNGGGLFHNLRVSFSRDGSVVQSITDLERRQQLDRAQIEPELISSVINQEREKRTNTEYKDLPPNLVNAIVAIEDRQYFEHPGINWRGIARALIRDYQTGEFREGGSSITQQLVKNFFLTPERTLKRKFSEAYMSIILEQRLSKEDIMSMYCNQIYLGQRGGFSINGFGQASRAYFGKDISSLTLSESALLAGIIQRPNYFSPYSSQERALERRNLVLEKMVEAEKIDRNAAEAAKRLPLGVVGKATGVDAKDAPYFIDYVMRQIENQYADGDILRSMRIYTTIDLYLQQAAYQAVLKNMADVDKMLAKRKGGTAGLQAALIAMNPKTGEILAMVGGRDYASSQLNRATDAKRQPGSAFKPFVYAAGLELGNEGAEEAITPASTFMDEPHTFEYDGKTYDPGNFRDTYENRPVTAREALAKSKNVVAVEVAQRIGFAQVSKFAEKAGFPRVPPYPSTALGAGEATPLQVATAYTAFANQGTRISPVAIKRVLSKDGTTLSQSSNETHEVMSPQVAYIMTDMLKDVLTYGTGTRVRAMGFQGVAAGKTGSSRDGWFAGYTPNLVCVVWVGFDNNTDIGLTGGATAAPIWADFMIRALKIRPELGGQFVQPQDGIVTFDIDPATGQPAAPGTANVRQELFLRGTEPGGKEEPSPTDSDNQPPKTDPDSPPHPTPTPKVPNEERARTAGARPSFFKRLADAIGLLSSDKTKPEPSPTPWSSAGLKSAGPTGRRDDAKIGFAPETQKVAAIPTPEVRTATPTPAPTQKQISAAQTKPAPTLQTKPIPLQTKPAPTPQVKPSTVAPVAPVAPVSAPALPAMRSTSSLRQPGTFIIEVCELTGLLPVEGVCTKTKRQRFQLGKEPTTSCSAERHPKN
jgi:penicillin-binding protein 1B